MPNSYGCIPLLPLPSELLLDILRLATDNPLRDIERYVELPPFESIESKVQDEQLEVALRTKRSIALTCSAFRRLCAGILYEDIRVGYGASSLADALERSEEQSPGSGLGRTVKRAVLIPTSSDDSVSPDRICRHTHRILACCPNIRVILRPRGSVSNGETDTIACVDSSKDTLQFPSLERIDWLSCPTDDPPVVAEMPHSVWSSDSLKTLSVGVKEWSRFTGMQETETVSVFSTVRTLRVRSIDAFGIPGQRLFTLELPSFRRLVLDQPDSMYAFFSIVHYCNQVETVEFGLHSGFLEHDYIMVLLVYCPKATKLYFPVFTTFVTRQNMTGASFTYLVEHIVLHAAVEDESAVDDAWKWEHLASQFETLCGEESRFSKLEQITLYGAEWRGFVSDPRFGPFLQLMRSRGIKLSCEDDTSRLLLQANDAREDS